jgi:hypothetical protein
MPVDYVIHKGMRAFRKKKKKESIAKACGTRK